MRIRPLVDGDAGALVALSLRAWAPVFDSLRRTLGDDLFVRLRPDWRADQRQAVRDVCRQEGGMRVLVDEGPDGGCRGFVAFAPDPSSGTGVVEMLGVDPQHQGAGVGSRLLAAAHDELRRAGMRVVMVETGGDPGHAPARRTYERAGATLLPIARYFTVLDGPPGTSPIGPDRTPDG